MKALVKSKQEPGVWKEEVPKPTIGPRDVLIKIRKAAICGTDINIYKWGEWAQKNVPKGTTMGHEFVGTITEVGAEVTQYTIGQRVTAESHIVCGQCRACQTQQQHLCVHTKVIGIHRSGAFAEYLAMPAENIFPVPDDIPDHLAAIFDPFGNAVHTTLLAPIIGEDVLITGAGPIGMIAAAIAKFGGARTVTVTDINTERLALAKTLGATHTFNMKDTTLQQAQKELDIPGFSVGLEMSGAPQALSGMVEVMYPGSTVGLLGILPSNTQIDWDQVIFKGLKLEGVFGRKMFETWYQMKHLLQGGLNIAPVITHHFHFDDYQDAFNAMLSGKSGKVVIDFHN